MCRFFECDFSLYYVKVLHIKFNFNDSYELDIIIKYKYLRTLKILIVFLFRTTYLGGISILPKQKLNIFIFKNLN